MGIKIWGLGCLHVDTVNRLIRPSSNTQRNHDKSSSLKRGIVPRILRRRAPHNNPTRRQHTTEMIDLFVDLPSTRCKPIANWEERQAFKKKNESPYRLEKDS